MNATFICYSEICDHNVFAQTRDGLLITEGKWGNDHVTWHWMKDSKE